MKTATRKSSKTLPLGDVAFEAWRNFLLANARLLRELDEQLRKEQNFSLGEFDVLVNLANAPAQRRAMCDLAGAILLSPSGLSRRVDRLERAGLVRRERGTKDARNVEAQLTPAGTKLLRRVRAAHLADIKERFADQFGEDELETIRDLMARLIPESEVTDSAC